MDDTKSNAKEKRTALKYFISSLSGAIVGLMLFTLLGPSVLFSRLQPAPRLTSPPDAAPQPVPQVDMLDAGDNPDVITASGKVVPSVVGIVTTRVVGNRRVRGVGSGVIVDSAGYILTNNHVAGRDAESIIVSLYDGREKSGRTVWADPALDLAIVKIDDGNLTAAALGDSKSVRIGQQAIAIGNPLGLTFQRTVTAGIISAVNRTVELEQGTFMEDLIQTDASINPGNSGGPLINIKGEVIGINTIKVQAAEALGFAVPINVVKPVVDKLRTNGRVSTPDIALQAVDKELGRIYDFIIDGGVYVYSCSEGGCAHKAGIKKGDAILSVNGMPVSTAIELKEALYRAEAGQKVKLRVKTAEGIEKEVEITLDGTD